MICGPFLFSTTNTSTKKNFRDILIKKKNTYTGSGFNAAFLKS